MDNFINKRVQDIEISGIRKFYNLVLKYSDAISLTIGQPDFDTPLHVKEAAKLALDNGKTTYTHNAGLMELREAACSFVKTKYSLNYDPNTEVITTNGASEAIDTALRGILEEGCEVIIPSPAYPGYEPVVKLMGAVPIYIDTTKTGFKLTADDLKKAITEKTRCIILPYPSNPTGCTMSAEEIKDIAEVLRDNDIFVLSDEIYSELSFDGKHISIATIDYMREKTIVINGLSKSHSMTGFRIGFIFAPEYICKHLIKVHQYNATCASTISQYAAIEALTKGIDDAIYMKEEYIKRRDYVYNRLVSMGFDVEMPSGAFYIFPSIKKFSDISFDFALDLLEKEKVAVVPSTAFSGAIEGYIRLSYAYSPDTLKEALDRIERYIKSITD
ncbi:aminotransferase A [Clostridium cylindrosporum]|uniref:Aminotransferase n=1 Tax=Clostridium cylindrosporum DSM 605 TaxID=1121307 RepID=A0A0J8DEL3_CLOCY|nr:aminotransferase A [Clostridium cylindrosporum]KMT22679.1 putative N-acetyl-LL-diaminopimelate aminotransferase PatA [Clostridium cylindrosporum DSM 605]